MEGNRPAAPMAEPPTMREFFVEFVVADMQTGGSKAVQGRFHAAGELSAFGACQGVAQQHFPHLKSYTLIDVEAKRVVAMVPLMESIAYFAPELNRASRTMGVAAAKIVAPEKFEGMVEEMRKQRGSS